MTDYLPPEPQPSRRDPLGFDEFVAILIAFATIGTILWWGIGRGDRSLQTAAESSPTEASESIFGSLLRGDEPDREGASTTPDASGIEAAEMDEEAAEPSVPVLPPQVRGDETEGDRVVTPLRDRSDAGPVVDAAEPGPVVSPVPPSPAPAPDVANVPAIAFTDVSPQYWAAPFIAALTQQGIVEGLPDGQFQPDQPVTRAQFATQLAQAFNEEVTAQPATFSDVPSGFWAAESIREATQMGFMNGYPGGVFRPDQPITRLEVLISLVTGLGLSDAATREVLSVYLDQDQIPSWAAPKIAEATQSGLVVSYPDAQRLSPSATTTRAEASAMIYQALVQAGRAEPIESSYIVRP